MAFVGGVIPLSIGARGAQDVMERPRGNTPTARAKIATRFFTTRSPLSSGEGFWLMLIGNHRRCTEMRTRSTAALFGNLPQAGECSL